MTGKTWRVLTVGAVVAATLMIPGTANASTSRCTVLANGEGVGGDLEDFHVIGVGTVECLTDGTVIGDLPDPAALAGSFIELSVSYTDPSVGGWHSCGDPTRVPLVGGVGTAAIVATCPYDIFYTYRVHLHAEIVYPSDVTAASSTVVDGPGTCIHDTSPNENVMICYADAVLT